MNARSMIHELARQFTAESDAAFDLWSWLPTYRRAVKEHRDYAGEYIPSIASVMTEAAVVLSCIRDSLGKPEAEPYGLTPEQEASILAGFECGCGEAHP